MTLPSLEEIRSLSINEVSVPLSRQLSLIVNQADQILPNTEAYNRLSPSFRSYLETLTAVHSGFEQAALSAAHHGHDTIKRQPVKNEHPLIRRHPVTGDKALSVRTFRPPFPILTR